MDIHDEDASGTAWYPTSQARLRSLHFDTIALSGSLLERIELSRKLNHDADVLSRTQSELRRSANSLLTVVRLPPDILLAIFTLVSEEEPPIPPLHSDNVVANGRGEVEKVPRGSLGWLRLLHVCNGWRVLIENTPTLWVRHVCRLPAAATTFLDRSLSAPLHVDITPPSRGYSTCNCCPNPRVHTVAERVRTLSWTITHLKDITSLVDFLHQTKMPILREATIEYNYDIRPFDYSTLPPINAPQLSKLSMHSMVVPFRSAGLRELFIGYIQLPSDELLEILRQYPALEKLELEACCPTQPVTSADCQVTLSRLQSIKLEEGSYHRYERPLVPYARQYVSLMQHLHAPPTAIYSIHLGAGFGIDDVQLEDLPLLGTISQSIQNEEHGEPIIAMGIFQHSVYLYTSTELGHNPGDVPRLNRFFELAEESRCAYHWVQPLGVFAEFLPQPQSQCDFRHLTVLVVVGDHNPVPAHEWMHLAHALCNLRLFHVSSLNACEVPPSLALSPSGDSVLLPDLRHFGLSGEEEVLIDERALSALVECLERRRGENPDKKLASILIGRLTDRHLEGGYATQIAPHANYVVWPDNPDGVSPLSSLEPYDEEADLEEGPSQTLTDEGEIRTWLDEDSEGGEG